MLQDVLKSSSSAAAGGMNIDLIGGGDNPETTRDPKGAPGRPLGSLRPSPYARGKGNGKSSNDAASSSSAPPPVPATHFCVISILQITVNKIALKVAKVLIHSERFKSPVYIDRNN